MKHVLSQHLTARLIRLITIGLSLALLAALPRSGHSAPNATTWYVVPGGGDSNNCLTPVTACEHIQAAIDKASSGDTINIAAGNYLENLTIIDKSLTLQGQGSATTIIDGSNLGRELFLSDDSPDTPMSVVVSGLRLQNGRSELGGAINNETATIYLTVIDSEIAGNTAIGTGGGGGIFNQGIMKLVNVVIRDNTASSGPGGGIYNLGEADLNNTTVTNNTAPAGGGIRNTNLMTITNSLIGVNNHSQGSNGGGIYNTGTGSKVTLLNSAVNGNQATAANGGGVYNDSILISSGTLISGNLATERGGGIFNATSGQVTFGGGSLRGNASTSQSGGALFNAGNADLTSVLVTNNRAGISGGGIGNTGNMTIDSNTITNNTAAGQPGGGINNQGFLTLLRSTLAYNAASASPGGGLYNSNTAFLTNVTLSDNTASSGGGIQAAGGTLELKYSTVSENSSPALNNAGGSILIGNSILSQTVGNACGGSITSAGYNLDTGTSCGFSSTGDLSSANPQLGPLRDNGGSSLTRAIAFGSAGQDTAANTCPPEPATDQRGIVRPQLGSCDRGAYEVAGYTNPNPLDIPAGLCVTSTLTINDQFAIGRLLAGVNLNYNNRTDLTIRLLSPANRRARLLGPAANSGQNLDTIFDDSAAQGVPAGDQNPASPFYDNVYKPAAPLSQFIGAGVKGNWKLEICNAGTSTGTLNRWVIVVPEITSFKVYMPLIRRTLK